MCGGSHALGARDVSFSAMASAERYDLNKKSWKPITRMGSARVGVLAYISELIRLSVDNQFIVVAEISKLLLQKTSS